jgi:purine-binding chemotaxis protein CheW
VNAVAERIDQHIPMQVLTLSLHGETFALDARHVREILDPVPVTEVPGAPQFLNGLINVRGKVVPLLDLGLKLGMPPSPLTIDTRFIVVEVTIAGVPTIVGVRADRVYEMTELTAEALEEAPQIGMRVRSTYVRCIGKRGHEFLIVLDLQAILYIARSPGEISNRRRHRRLKVAMPCRIDMNGESVSARIADLSEGGAAITGLPKRPSGGSGQIEIETVTDKVNFRVVDFHQGTLRLKFEPSGNAAVSALVRRLEKESAHAA